MDQKELTIEKFMQPTHSALICDGEAQIGSVLDLVDSTHGALLVFEQNIFQGICSPYQTLYKRSMPHTTKVAHALTHPRHLYPDSTIFEALEFMIGERIYTLPVFDKESGEVIGVIEARNLVKTLTNDSLLMKQIAKNLEYDKVLTSSLDAKVKDIYKLMRQKNGSSRVVLIDVLGKVSGIVARSDIKYAFIDASNRQRFSKSLGSIKSIAFDPKEHLRRVDDPVKNYYTQSVATVQYDTDPKIIIQTLISSDKNSLVITDLASQPVGIVSLRTILRAVYNLMPQDEINISYTRPSTSVSDELVNESLEIINLFLEKYKRRMPIEKIEINFDEPKYSSARTAIYNAHIRIFPLKGKTLMASAKAKDFLQSLRSALRQIETQHDRNHQISSSHHHRSLGDISSQTAYFMDIKK